ncbi:MAG: ATP-binding cassette domain-containing protein, partial [Sulfurimonas sp.]|nr:ATP-binding cassette domain-containing protein [Sulfurimonas sp.]
QRKITKSIIYYSKQIVDGNSKTNLAVLQILNNMKYLLSTNSYKYINKQFDKVSNKYSFDLQKISFLNSIPKHTPEFVGIIVISSIIIINELTIKENIATVVVVGLLLYRTLTKFMSIQKSYQDFLINIGAVEKIIEIESLTINKNINNLECKNKIEIIEEIDFVNIDFNIYNKTILKSINLTLNKNNIYAIVGKSGSGKSSLINIITQLYQPSSGHILLNQVNLDNYNRNYYRDKIGYVSQESVIFEGTIKENIIFDKKFNKDYYQDLIMHLTIDKIDIKTLSMGGTNISGGQRQLIALARELYKNPYLLILDEFTSALDSVTEKIVMSYIHKLKKDKIIIIIAHRLSSVIRSDKVILMEEGKILFKDKFENLYQLNETFKIMCNNQNIYL